MNRMSMLAASAMARYCWGMHSLRLPFLFQFFQRIILCGWFALLAAWLALVPAYALEAVRVTPQTEAIDLLPVIQQ